MRRLISDTRVTEGAGNQDTYEPGVIEALLGTLGEVHKGLRTLNGSQLLGAVPRGITNGQSAIISTSPGRLAGWSIHETAGAAAVLRLRDGTSLNGDPLGFIALAANGVESKWFMPTGIAFSYGLYVEVVSGAVEGVVYLSPLP